MLTLYNWSVHKYLNLIIYFHPHMLPLIKDEIRKDNTVELIIYLT